jgi:hypothetical protein
VVLMLNWVKIRHTRYFVFAHHERTERALDSDLTWRKLLPAIYYNKAYTAECYNRPVASKTKMTRPATMRYTANGLKL